MNRLGQNEELADKTLDLRKKRGDCSFYILRIVNSIVGRKHVESKRQNPKSRERERSSDTTPIKEEISFPGRAHCPYLVRLLQSVGRIM